MLILPIVNKRRVMNVEIRLKGATKIRSGVFYDDAKESDIIVNREKFSESSFKDSRDVKAPADFVRSKSLLHPRNFLITTKEEKDSSLYDVYEVTPPPKQVNESLDKLYGKALTDLRKEIPGVKQRGRYVSLEKLGLDDHLTEEKMAEMQHIIKEHDAEEWPRLFQEAGIADLADTVDFINYFEMKVLSDHTIPEDSLQDTLKAMSAINTRDYRHLKNYYHTAKANTNIYTKLSYLSQMLYDKPLTLSQKSNQDSKDGIKVLQKTIDEVEHNRAA